MRWTVNEATRNLAASDPVMAELIARHGPMRIPVPPPASKRFESLARSIAFQQLNGRAAESIWIRTVAVVGEPVTAEAVVAVDESSLRGAGLSGSKVAALVDLARHELDGSLELERLGRCSDAEVVARLTQVRGVGPWTAHMFSMFTLRRPDIWPVGDYGVRNGYGRAWLGGHMPDERTMHQLGERFAPWRSVAAWYCWRAADDPTFG
jgi:3-methyladenine DNA glycosylase/8-oxoguanine DNA glycosylase